jgi:hypothetical protein
VARPPAARGITFHHEHPISSVMGYCSRCNTALQLIRSKVEEEGGVFKAVSKHEKLHLRFCDYYSFMSYSDFTAWVEADDESAPQMSFSEAITLR